MARLLNLTTKMLRPIKLISYWDTVYVRYNYIQLFWVIVSVTCGLIIQFRHMFTCLCSYFYVCVFTCANKDDKLHSHTKNTAMHSEMLAISKHFSILDTFFHQSLTHSRMVNWVFQARKLSRLLTTINK